MTRPHSRATRRAKSQRRLATKRKQSKSSKTNQSSKIAGILRLIESLSAGLGSTDGVVLGRGIARFLTNAYGEQQRPLPRWVKGLIARYTPKKRSS